MAKLLAHSDPARLTSLSALFSPQYLLPLVVLFPIARSGLTSRTALDNVRVSLHLSTLTGPRLARLLRISSDRVSRRQLHGEDHLSTADIHHLLAVGSRRAAGIREHVATSLQRCGGDPLHV